MFYDTLQEIKQFEPLTMVILKFKIRWKMGGHMKIFVSRSFENS